MAAQNILAKYEGIFCEPASSTSLAGAINEINAGRIPEGSQIVCTLTGHGLKDPDIVIQQSGTSRIVTVEATLDAVSDVILSSNFSG